MSKLVIGNEEPTTKSSSYKPGMLRSFKEKFANLQQKAVTSNAMNQLNGIIKIIEFYDTQGNKIGFTSKPNKNECEYNYAYNSAEFIGKYIAEKNEKTAVEKHEYRCTPTLNTAVKDIMCLL